MNLIETLINLDGRLHWNVTLNPIETLAFARVVDPELAKMIREINELIPVINYGPENPNTGHTYHNFKVGRECSRVVYLELVKAYLPKNFNYFDLFGELTALSEKYGADEFTIDEGDRSVSARFWWD